MTVNSLIDNALIEIAGDYKKGLLTWLKRQPDVWARLLKLEARVNDAALTGDHLDLVSALKEFKDFFEEMTKTYREGDQGNLF